MIEYELDPVKLTRKINLTPEDLSTVENFESLMTKVFRQTSMVFIYKGKNLAEFCVLLPRVFETLLRFESKLDLSEFSLDVKSVHIGIDAGRIQINMKLNTKGEGIFDLVKTSKDQGGLELSYSRTTGEINVSVGPDTTVRKGFRYENIEV